VTTTPGPAIRSSLPGEKVLEQQDFAWESPLPLTLQRTYRSQVGGGVMFGPSWPSNFDWPMLKVVDICITGQCFDRRRLILQLPGGELRYFTDRHTDFPFTYYPQNYVASSPKLSGYVTTNASGEYTYYLRNRVFAFNAQGYLTSIQQNGTVEYRFTYQASPAGRLQSVTNAYGKSIQFFPRPAVQRQLTRRCSDPLPIRSVCRTRDSH
jgi:YD repeat-containing protein